MAPKIIEKPVAILSCGKKKIEEFVGNVATKTQDISIAHMHASGFWSEVGQCPEFDEYTLVLEGVLRIEFRDGSIEISVGQAVVAQRGEWVRYSNPIAKDLEYISVCVPAFSPQKAHRDAS